jgi:hypothetical protein
MFKISFLLIVTTLGCWFSDQKKELDPRLVGRWEMLFSKDVNGAIIKDDFYGKRYKETYTKDGKLILDPQFLRDDMKSRGINEPLDYGSIPTLNWKSIDNEILETESDYGSQQARYGFAGDTLILGYPNGNTRYLLKRK